MQKECPSRIIIIRRQLDTRVYLKSTTADDRFADGQIELEPSTFPKILKERHLLLPQPLPILDEALGVTTRGGRQSQAKYSDTRELNPQSLTTRATLDSLKMKQNDNMREQRMQMVTREWNLPA